MHTGASSQQPAGPHWQRSPFNPFVLLNRNHSAAKAGPGAARVLGEGRVAERAGRKAALLSSLTFLFKILRLQVVTLLAGRGTTG